MPDPSDDHLLRALRGLPAPEAPRTFVARVMAAVDARARRPWYARAWSTWPRGWQAASVTALVALAAGCAMWGAPIAGVLASGASWPVVARLLDPVGRTWRQAAALTGAIDVLYRALLEPVVGYAAVLVLLMCGACVTAGAALSRVALGGASQP